MFTTRVQGHLGTSRLIAEYYSGAHLADAECLRTWRKATLDALRQVDALIVYGVLKPDGVQSNCRVAKAEVFDGMFVNAEDCESISQEMYEEFSRATALTGDILIAIGGYVGRPALLQYIPMGLQVVVNRHLARFRPDPQKVDPHYAAAYLSSAIGERQLRREITGSVQAGINLEDLRLVVLPLPADLAQQYIGDKVRQAERLREQSSFSLRFATRLVDLLIDGELREEDVRAGRVDLTRVTSPQERGQTSRAVHTRTVSADLTDRIDAWFYKPDLVAACNKIKKSGAYSTLADVIDGERDVKGGATPLGAEYLTKGAVRFFRTSDVWGLAVHTGETVFITAEQDQDLARSRLADGDVLLTITGADFGHAGAIKPSHLPGNISQHSVRFRPTIDESYLVAYLESHYGQQVIWRQAYGATGPAIDYPGVKGLLIRLPDPSVQKVIGDAVRSGVKARDLAHSLTAAAKRLVEALIEKGKDFESELSDAQEALLRGDTGPDRAILQRLTSKGIDVENESPLFPYLDDLYAALEESAGASVTVEARG